MQVSWALLHMKLKLNENKPLPKIESLTKIQQRWKFQHVQSNVLCYFVVLHWLKYIRYTIATNGET